MEFTTIIFWLVIVGLILVIPRFGAIALYRRWKINREIERGEDTLKVLFDAQQQNRSAGLRTLMASLHISEKAALRLAERMQTQGLVATRGSDLRLTPEGERLALQLTRAHRLWERYLVTEARMPLDKVHQEAHRREHGMTPQQVDEMEAALGFPLHDPHGDPIPSRQGEIKSEDTTPLTDWQPGVPGRIVHLEDEPPIALAQIVAEGLRLNQVIRILEITPSRLSLTDGENEYRLAPMVAANVFVAPIPVDQKHSQAISLAALAHKQPAEIIALDEACQGFTRRRFLDLGLTPGTRIFPELKNSFGDPRAYRVRGTLIALREDQASQIWVRPV
jgi:DtxR family Mn-dependent transcriptional regulator